MKVKECPFCGSLDIRSSNKTTDRGNKRHVSMFCNKCHCYGPRTIIPVNKTMYVAYEDRKTMFMNIAIKEWNKRR